MKLIIFFLVLTCCCACLPPAVPVIETSHEPQPARNVELMLQDGFIKAATATPVNGRTMLTRIIISTSRVAATARYGEYDGRFLKLWNQVIFNDGHSTYYCDTATVDTVTWCINDMRHVKIFMRR